MDIAAFMGVTTLSVDFLSRLRSRFATFFRLWSDPFRKPPLPDEPLCRFLIPKEHFDRKTGQVLPDAFLPWGDPPETSVFRFQGLPDAEVWSAGEAVARKRKRTLRGRAVVRTEAIQGANLFINPDNQPRRHASIRGWPTEKHEWMDRAALIAAAALLELKS